MSNLSNYLKKHLEKNNISVKEFSQLCNFSILEAKAFINGTSLPQSPSELHRIYNGLHMSLNEWRYLIEYYIQETEGNNLLESFNLIDKIFFHQILSKNYEFSSLPLLKCTSLPEIQENYLTLSNNKEILEAINYALEYNLLHGSTEIYAYMQPEAAIYNTILHYSRSSHIRFNQICCLDYSKPDTCTQNLKILNLIIPLLFSHSRPSINYYHDNVKSHINDLNVMPFVFSIGNIVIFMDSKYTQGYFVKDKEYSFFIKNIFLSIKQRTHPYAVEYTSDRLYEFLCGYNGDIFSICSFPYDFEISNSNSRRHYILPASQTRTFYQDGTPPSLFGNKKSLSQEESCSFFKKLLLAARDNSCEFYFTKDSYPFPTDAGVIFSDNLLFIFYSTSELTHIWRINDSTIARCLVNYFYYGTNNSMTMSLEQSVEWLENLINSNK